MAYIGIIRHTYRVKNRNDSGDLSGYLSVCSRVKNEYIKRKNLLIEIPFFDFEFLINRLTLIDLFNLSIEDLVANR
jgi:hypothetical protein